ncbi:MAG: ankyrin repeat domain-containing protein [Woeseiaceae bacterium]|nr:ankyrin repeat domain-containing protein [Woeseiaceae bacterium]
MGIVRTVYNFVMGLIGLIILVLVAYVFIVAKWEEHKEEQLAEERAEIAEAVAETARERGLGDLDQLRQNYVAACRDGVFKIIEGDADEVCSAIAGVLLVRSQERGMSLFDQVDVELELCALEAREYGGDPDEYCVREEYLYEALRDALAVGLCGVESAWLFDDYYGGSTTKRGPDVYRNGDFLVDCDSRRVYEWDYEGFFEGMTGEEERIPILDQLYDALYAENYDAVRALLDEHEFGQDELTDLWLLNQFLYEPVDQLLPEVLKRNGGKVNFLVRYYQQPLTEAIGNESTRAALLLLEAGADPVRPGDDYGKTPIVKAASRGMLDVVKALIEKGADVNGVVGSESLDFGEPLFWAAWDGHEEVALWLLANGATAAPEDPAAYPQWDPLSLLDRAVVGGSAAVVAALIEQGARSEDMARLFEGAADSGNPDVVELLFTQGYKLPEVKHHDRIYDGVVAAIQESEGRRIEDGLSMFELLLDSGLDMSRMYDSGWNYAHQAVKLHGPPSLHFGKHGDRLQHIRDYRLRFVKRVVDEVLATGMDIDHRAEGVTLLMEAADGAQPEIVRYLLDLGADATLTNDRGETPLDIVVREGRRMTRIWDEKPELKLRYGDSIEHLGGSREMLDTEASN